MNKYLVLYHAPADAMAASANMTPEQQQAGIQAWMQWAQTAADKLVDLGAPLINGQWIGQSGGGASQKNVGGYSIIQAKDMEEAKALFKDHPHTKWHPEATIELHEVKPLPGM